MNTTTTTSTGQWTNADPTAAENTDMTPTTEPTTTHTAVPTAAATDDELDIPTQPPTPETTVYRDTETVIRLLQTKTMDDALEVRVYRVEDTSLTGGASIATDGGRPEQAGLDALPTVIRERVDRVVETAAERFDLQPEQTNGGYGQFRTRWTDRGFDGIDEFAVTLQEQ